jgi:hypothetical protein
MYEPLDREDAACGARLDGPAVDDGSADSAMSRQGAGLRKARKATVVDLLPAATVKVPGEAVRMGAAGSCLEGRAGFRGQLSFVVEAGRAA